MIEPQSAHDGASAWVTKLTLVAPRFRVIVPVPVPPPAPFPDLPFPLPLPLVAWPLVARTASSSRTGVADSAGAGSAATAVAFGVASFDPEGSAPEAAGGAAASGVSGYAPHSGEGSAASARSEAGPPIEPPPSGADPVAGTSSTIADRSISPRLAFSSGARNRDPSHRKM